MFVPRKITDKAVEQPLGKKRTYLLEFLAT